MNDLNALLRSIITNHDDDTVRLAYADALDELPTKTVTCRSCGGRGSGMIRFLKYNEQSEGGIAFGCSACDDTGTVTDTTNRDRAAFIRKSIEFKDRGYECYSHPQHYDVGFDTLPGGVGNLTEYRRGFLEEWYCTAEQFLAHADELVWHPTQTVDVGKCSCSMYGRDGWVVGAKTWEKCTTCAGTGRKVVPRPCPNTAQPITRVVLTSCADLDAFLIDNQFSVKNVSPGKSVWSSPKWPGVGFDLSYAGEFYGGMDSDRDAPLQYSHP